MRALTVVEPGQVELQQRPDLTADEGHALVAPQMVGVCGTDLDIIDGTIDPNFVRYPLVIGHEFSGTLLSARRRICRRHARRWSRGSSPAAYAKSAAAAQPTAASTYDELGFIRDGAGADLLLAPSSQIHPLAPAA